MIQELGWKNLQDRRKDIRLTMLYKIINDQTTEIEVNMDTNTV
jgi:hypothetical protein